MKKRLNYYRFVIIFFSIILKCIGFCGYINSTVVKDIDGNYYNSHVSGNDKRMFLDKSDKSNCDYVDTTEFQFVGTVTLPEVDIQNLPSINRIIDAVINEMDSIYIEKNMYYSLCFGSPEEIKSILKKSGKLNDAPVWFYIITPIIDDYIMESSKNKYPGYFYYKNRLFLINNKPDNGIELNYTGGNREFTLYRSIIPLIDDGIDNFFIVNGNTVWRLQPHIDDEGVLTWDLFRICWKQRNHTTNF